MIQAILWDNDGVLVDTERLYFQANREALARVGVELSEQQYIDLLLVQAKGVWHMAQERTGLDDIEIGRLRGWRNERYAELLRGGPVVIPGVEQALRRLHGRFRMGIVTSSLREHFDIIHASSGLRGYFEFVVASGDYKRSKPEPDPYLAGLEQLGVPAADCVVVEDSQRGLEAARRAGLPCYIVPTDITRGCDFGGAEAVLDNLDTFADAVLREADQQGATPSD